MYGILHVLQASWISYAGQTMVSCCLSVQQMVNASSTLRTYRLYTYTPRYVSARPLRWIRRLDMAFHYPTCSQALVKEAHPLPRRVPSTVDKQPRSLEREFDFVERPPQDFFCPVTFELLLEPQQTSCCGNHLSPEAATRLKRERKLCPVCNGEEWSVVLDKYHRRKVREVRVRCWYKESGCEWEGEVNELKRHDDSCVKRPWECEYCSLKCTYGEGEDKHWPVCPKYPEPCPNGCEVGCVARCNIEQHLSVCSLEPVACEMKEFGCSVVVPRKELATHMRESELQHLTAMTRLNLRLTRQLQQEMADLKKLQTEMKTNMDEQTRDHIKCKGEEKRMMNEHMKKYDVLQRKIFGELTELNDRIQGAERTSHHIEKLMGSGCSGCEVFKFADYSNSKRSKSEVHSHPFYSQHNGYKCTLIVFYSQDGIGARLSVIKGEFDDTLIWPIGISVELTLLNQAGHHHPKFMHASKWARNSRNRQRVINDCLITYSNLENQSDGVQYVMNDCLKFRIQITVL